MITKELSVYWFIFNISRAIFCADFSPFRPHLTQKNHHFNSKKSPFLTLAFALAGRNCLGVAQPACCFAKTKRRFVRTKRRFAKINRRFDINKTPFYSRQSEEFENQLFARCKFLWFRLLQTAQKKGGTFEFRPLLKRILLIVAYFTINFCVCIEVPSITLM